MAMDEHTRRLLDAIQQGKSAEECAALAEHVPWATVHESMGDDTDHPLLWAIDEDRMDIYRALRPYVDISAMKAPAHGHALNGAVQYYDRYGSCEDTTEVLRELLADGFDPLANLGGGHTALRETLFRQVYPEKYKMMLEAVWPRFANKKRGSALACRSKKKNLDPSVDRGVMPFARRWFMEATPRWELMLGRCEPQVLARAIADLEGYPLHEGAEKKLVRVEIKQLFVFGLVGMPWTIVMQEVGASYQPSSERLRATAAGVSREKGIETLFFYNPEVERFVDGEVVEHHDWSIESAPAEAFNGTDERIDSLEDQLNEQMDAWFRDHDVLIPSMSWTSEGVFIKLVLNGLKKPQVSGLCILDSKTLEQAVEEERARKQSKT